ncbi:hypothetical protein [Sphingomonas sp. KC8]|uniref:hypothetical protein n=1 Tax=Sphingomonas sp. KC8 TaxID=1030157 RepID=UPI000308737E|nr:hypothetical protein [Sphingomonas sp. KC8]
MVAVAAGPIPAASTETQDRATGCRIIDEARSRGDENEGLPIRAAARDSEDI